MPPREKSRSGESPSEDIRWKFADPLPNTRHKLHCKLCGKLITGGITRLKQHLAHLKGQVQSCPNVSTEIREEMMKHILSLKNKKIEKRKQRDEVAAHIRASQQQYGDDDDEEYDLEGITVSSDDSDPELTMARQASVREHRAWEENQRYRARVGERYDVGGSSSSSRAVLVGSSGLAGPPRASIGRRSASVRESSSRSRKWIDPNTPEARLQAMDPVLHRTKTTKQQKLSTKVMKTLRSKLGGAVSQFIIYGRLSANVVLNPWFKPMLDVAREVGPNVDLPTPYEVTEVYLPKEYDELKKWIESHRLTWEERGVTIMCDGWTGPTRKHIINFLVYSNRGTIFHKSIDATDVTSRNADYYLGIMDKVVEEIGEKYVVQVVTDNEPALKLAGKKLMLKRPNLYWTACAAHCIDLMLHDIGKKKIVEKVLDDGKKITSFIYNSTWLVDLMKRFTNGTELLRPAITRFASNFIMLESIVRHKKALEDMFSSSEWRNSKWGKKNNGKGYEVRNIIFEREFWSKAGEIMKVQEPLVRVLRLVDGDEKPTMGFLYEAMDRAKLAIQKDCRYYKEFWKIIDKRWSFQLHHDLHAAGYFLNPQFQYGGPISNYMEVMDGVKKVIQRLEPDIDNQIRAINQILLFRDKQDSFSTVIAQRAVQHTNPAEWWIHYGTSAPELQRIAIKVLSQTTSASNCERNWSTFSLIHTKTRNRPKYQKLNKLVYVYYNMRLKIRHATRRSQRDIDAHFNPINLDYIFEEDDPLAPWLQEREEPVLDGQDNSDWLNLDDDDNDYDNATSQAQRNIQSSNLHASGSDGDGDGGLGPLSSSHTDTNSPPDEGNTGAGQYEVGVSGHGNRSNSPFRGELGIYCFRDNEEIGEEPEQLSRGSRPTNVADMRRHGHLSSDDSYDAHSIMHQFGELGIGQPNWNTQHYPPMMYPQPLVPSSYYPPPPSHYQPTSIAYPPSPVTYPPSENYFESIFQPPIPYGYVYQHHENSSGSGGSNTIDTGIGSSNYFYGQQPYRQTHDDDDDDDGQSRSYQDPPRHSFWI